MIFQVIRGSTDFTQLESLVREDFAYLLCHRIYGYQKYQYKAFYDVNLGQIILAMLELAPVNPNN